VALDRVDVAVVPAALERRVSGVLGRGERDDDERRSWRVRYWHSAPDSRPERSLSSAGRCGIVWPPSAPGRGRSSTARGIEVKMPPATGLVDPEEEP
jgi:hypothetical protein